MNEYSADCRYLKVIADTITIAFDPFCVRFWRIKAENGIHWISSPCTRTSTGNTKNGRRKTFGWIQESNLNVNTLLIYVLLPSTHGSYIQPTVAIDNGLTCMRSIICGPVTAKTWLHLKRNCPNIAPVPHMANNVFGYFAVCKQFGRSLTQYTPFTAAVLCW